LRTTPEGVPPKVAQLAQRAKVAEKGSAGGNGQVDLDSLASGAVEIAGVPVVAAVVDGIGGKDLMQVADRLRNRLGDGVVALGSSADDKVSLVVAVAPAIVERGVRAGDVVRIAAPVVGGGGGGKDTMAQAGGKDPQKLGDALDAARQAIADALGETGSSGHTGG
jgi:alanyl-tRNA synthetase